MTYSRHIPILQANGEVIPTLALSRVIQASAETSWKNIMMEQHQVPGGELPNLMYYFSRLFKEATGKSPHQFIIEARIFKARHASGRRQHFYQ